MRDYPREPKQGEREADELRELLDVQGAAPVPELFRDPNPPTRAQQWRTRALVLTAMLAIAGVSVGSVGNWGAWQWWPPIGDAPDTVCTAQATTPTLTATNLTGDTTATLEGSAFASVCAGAVHVSSSWWITKDTGAADDTVWSDFASDSLVHWSPAGITAGASGWNPGDTLVARVFYTPDVGAASATAVDTFVATGSRVLLFQTCWDSTGTSDRRIMDSTAMNATPWPGVVHSDSAILEVVSAAAVGWVRRGNPLAMKAFGLVDDEGLLFDSLSAYALPISTTHYGRLWFRNDRTAGQPDAHPLVYPWSGALSITAYRVPAMSSGAYAMLLDGPTGSSGDDTWGSKAATTCSLNGLQDSTWYRYEWRVQYVAADSVRVWPRIYSDSGTRIYDAENAATGAYTNISVPCSDSLADNLTTFRFRPLAGASAVRTFGLGWPTYGGSSRTDEPFYVGCFALDTAGWIGDTIMSVP